MSKRQNLKIKVLQQVTAKLSTVQLLSSNITQLEVFRGKTKRN